MTNYSSDENQVGENSSEWSGIDKRIHERFDSKASFIVFPLETFVNGQRSKGSFSATSVNLSHGGLLFCTKKDLDIDSLIIIKFRLCDVMDRVPENLTDTRTFITVARVIRINEILEGTFQAGVQFDTVVEGNIDELQEAIEAS